MRIVLTSARSLRARAPRLGGEIIQCGPSFANRMIGGRYTALSAPQGAFDLNERLQALPAEQEPDVILCLLHGNGAVRPGNLRAFACPKILLVDELDASAVPHALHYAKTEPFDRIVFVGSLMHLAAFQSAGVGPLSWFPGLLFTESDKRIAHASARARADSIAVVANPETLDCRLLAKLVALDARDLALEVKPFSDDHGLEHIGESLVALAPTTADAVGLPGFMAVAAGTVLLAPVGPTPFAGHEFCVFYRTTEELVEKAAQLIAKPEEAKSRGESGRRWFSSILGDSARMDAFRRLVCDGIDVPEFAIPTAEALVPAPPRPDRETSKDVDGMIRQIQELLDSGDIPRALERSRQAITKDPRSIAGYVGLAWLAIEAGNRDLCRQMLEQAHKLVPSDPLVQWMRCLHRRGQLEPSIATRVMALAWCAYERKDYDLARTLMSRVLKIKNRCATADHLLGLVLLDTYSAQKDYTEIFMFGDALRHLNAAASFGDDSAILRDLAVASRQAGLFPEAIAAYQRILASDSDDASLLFGLGETFFASGRINEAVEVFNRALLSSPHDPRFLLWLGHCRKRQGLLHEASVLHARAFGRVLPFPVQPSKRRRVAFLVQHPPMWTNTASVYRAFSADPSWDAQVIALPYRMHAFTGQYDVSEAIYTFLDQEKVSYVRWDELTPVPNFADVVFVENPYEHSRPVGWRTPDLIRLVPRLAYIPYALEIGGGSDNAGCQWNLTLQQTAWAIFARSERERGYFARHCSVGAAHVSVTGHPRIDAMRGLTSARDSSLERQIAGRTPVLWNPHLDVRINGTSFGRGYSTFLHWRHIILEEFARRPDLFLIIRPHPQLFAKLHQYGVLTQGQIDDYLALCDTLPNVVIDRRASYLPALAHAKAMISDASSLMLEYSVTGNPMLYLRNPFGPGLNEDGALVIDHHQTAETAGEMAAFLDHLNLNDAEKRQARISAAGLYLLQPAEGAGVAIKRVVEERLNGEPSGEKIETDSFEATDPRSFWRRCADTHLAPGDYYERAAAALAAQASRYLTRDETVIDFGCGNGEMTMVLAPFATELIGFDLSPSLVDQARSRASALGVSSAKFEVLDLEEGLPDSMRATAVMCLGVSSCVHDDEKWTDLIRHFASLLPPGGVLFVRDTVVASRPRRILHPSGYHACYRELKSYRALILEAGFEEAECVNLFSYDNGLVNNLWVFRRLDAMGDTCALQSADTSVNLTV